jgi:glucose-6-phosphate isomerase
MVELEKGAIANPDEGRMVGHYWLRDSNRAPNSFLKNKIDTTLDAICKFADDIVSGKVSQWIMFLFNRKQAKLLLLV